MISTLSRAMLVLIFLLSPIVAPVSSANELEQSAVSQNSQCLLDTPLQFSFQDEGPVEISDNFTGSITVTNNTPFVVSDTTIGIALFAEGSIEPSHWVLLEESVTIQPESVTGIDYSLNTQYVPAGLFTVKAFSSQAGVEGLLGEMYLNNDTAAKVVSKSISPAETVSLLAQVNGSVTNPVSLEAGEELVVTTTVENNTQVMQRDVQLISIIAAGEIPLGAAVQKINRTEFKIFPGNDRMASIDFSPVPLGSYSVFVGALMADTLYPVRKTNVISGEESEGLSWPYISRIGFSDATGGTSNMVVCIDYVGENAGSLFMPEPQSVVVSAVDSAGNSSSETVVKSDDITVNYFSVVLDSMAGAISYDVSLLTQSDSSVFGVPEQDDMALTDNPEFEYQVIQTIELKALCADESECVSDTEEVDTPAVSTTDDSQSGNSFYFYAAIVIAAALLLYVMLRRLHPEEATSIKTNTD